jgi:Ion channel
VALVLATVNNIWAPEMGLKLKEPSFVDALYFTIITLTTIGYGDITPTTTLGKLIVSGEGVTGFVLFATLASMVYRKILP